MDQANGPWNFARTRILFVTLTYAKIYSEGFSDPELNRAFEAGLASARSADPRECPHYIDGVATRAGEPFTRTDPVDRSRVVAKSWSADKATIDKAVEAGKKAFPGWAALSSAERHDIIAATVPLYKKYREELATLVSLEAGKTRAEAYTEVDECIVVTELFLKQYRESGDQFTHQLTAPPNAKWAGTVYRPYGVFGVIAPFNFPLAITSGMAACALMTGNTTVVKPSGLTPACGEAVYKLFLEAGVPAGAINLVQGGGETGALLAASAIDAAIFTGSADAGLDIVAQMTRPPYVRPVIAEMGGKNPAIVTDTADIEMAARAITRSAYPYTSQKCTACSRAVVFDSVYDQFIEALVAEAKPLAVGDPMDESVFDGPVISEQSVQRFQNAVELARNEGRVVLGGGSSAETGNFVDLTIIDGFEHGHRLTRDELFVPVLSVIKVSDMNQAMAEANAIRFGLSAGVFAKDEAQQKQFLDTIEAGILMVNSPVGATTGIWPGNQTMAGWKSSGTTGKGGYGPYYLQQFVREQSRTIY